MEHYMKTHNIPHQGQYSEDLHFMTEVHVNMNHGSSAMIAEARKMHHKMVVDAKVIKSTALTEKRDSIGPKIDVTKNYSRLPKTMSDPQPNDAGEPVARALYKKDAKSGMAKGGIKYGKGR